MKPDGLFQGSFKSSLRKKRRASIKRKKAKEENRPFIIKPIPSPLLKPLIVFINPKSGGNQGAKLMHKFCWWLNPRQVFDLSHGGPRAGYVMQNMEGKKKLISTIISKQYHDSQKLFSHYSLCFFHSSFMPWQSFKWLLGQKYTYTKKICCICLGCLIMFLC